jgi:hypothetical protein
VNLKVTTCWSRSIVAGRIVVVLGGGAWARGVTAVFA